MELDGIQQDPHPVTRLLLGSILRIHIRLDLLDIRLRQFLNEPFPESLRVALSGLDWVSRSFRSQPTRESATATRSVESSLFRGSIVFSPTA